MKTEKIKRKLKKTYIKMLYAFSEGLISRGYELEDKAIRLELKLRVAKGRTLPSIEDYGCGDESK